MEKREEKNKEGGELNGRWEMAEREVKKRK